MAVKIKMGGGDDPKEKKSVKVKVSKTTPSPEALAEATQLAQRLVSQHGGFNAENIHTGGQIPKFLDAVGREIPAGAPPPEVGNLPTNVPGYVKKLEWDAEKNLPFYVDEKTGYMQYVPKDLFYSARFNPKRGVSLSESISVAKR